MDLSLNYSAALSGWDIVVDEGAPSTNNTLAEAVLLSLFSDGRVDSSAALEATGNAEDVRGYWGDDNENESGRFGSKLWLYHRQKITPQVVSRIQQAAINSLQWMIEDGIAGAVNAEASVEGDSRVNLVVTIDRSFGESERYEFNDIYSASVGVQ